MSDKAEQQMEEFDSLLHGLPLIFQPGTNVIDAESIEISCDKYDDFGHGVSAREPISNTDIRSHHPGEEAGREILQQKTDPEIRRKAFSRFTPGAKMRKQCHPQREEAYVLQGEFTDEVSGKTWRAGEVARFNRMQEHTPCSETGCLLLLIFT